MITNIRNTKAIGFNTEEHAIIVAAAKKAGLYPRQLIMLAVQKLKETK